MKLFGKLINLHLRVGKAKTPCSCIWICNHKHRHIYIECTLASVSRSIYIYIYLESQFSLNTLKFIISSLVNVRMTESIPFLFILMLKLKYRVLLEMADISYLSQNPIGHARNAFSTHMDYNIPFFCQSSVEYEWEIQTILICSELLFYWYRYGSMRSLQARAIFHRQGIQIQKHGVSAWPGGILSTWVTRMYFWFAQHPLNTQLGRNQSQAIKCLWHYQSQKQSFLSCRYI